MSAPMYYRQYLQLYNNKIYNNMGMNGSNIYIGSNSSITINNDIINDSSGYGRSIYMDSNAQAQVCIYYDIYILYLYNNTDDIDR